MPELEQPAAGTTDECRVICQKSVHDGALRSGDKQARQLRKLEDENQELRRLLAVACRGESRSGNEDAWSGMTVTELRTVVFGVHVKTPSRAGSGKGEGSRVAGDAGNIISVTWGRPDATKENVSATSKASPGATSVDQERRALRPINGDACVEIAGGRSSASRASGGPIEVAEPQAHARASTEGESRTLIKSGGASGFAASPNASREKSSVTATKGPKYCDVAMVDAVGDSVPVIGRLFNAIVNHASPGKGTGQPNPDSYTGAETAPIINDGEDEAAESSDESPDVAVKFAHRRQARLMGQVDKRAPDMHHPVTSGASAEPIASGSGDGTRTPEGDAAEGDAASRVSAGA